jgi:hypothetical protein
MQNNEHIDLDDFQKRCDEANLRALPFNTVYVNAVYRGKTFRIPSTVLDDIASVPNINPREEFVAILELEYQELYGDVNGH